MRSVSKGLNSMVTMVKDLAEGEGDLTKRLEVVSRDELGELAEGFNTFLDKIHNIVSQVAATAEQLASASEELSSSATLQAQGADHQKDQATQVATAMQKCPARFSRFRKTVRTRRRLRARQPKPPAAAVRSWKRR